MRRSTSLALLLLALSATGAAALESDAEPAIGLSNNLGLCGFQDMVDARVPGFISLRGGLRYDVTIDERKLDGVRQTEREKEQHDFTAWAGASAFGCLDAAIKIPYLYRRDETDPSGPDTTKSHYDEGWGDMEVAGKLGYSFGGLLNMATYGWGRMPTGEPDVGDIASFEFGSAATLSLLNEFLAIHANLSGIQLEPGNFAFRYRAGASFVFVATEILTLRAYGYVDGLEHEGSANSDIDLDLGVQAILFQMFTAEVGTSVRLVDSGHIDDTLEDELNAQAVADRHFDDDNVWGLSLVVGVLLTF